MRTALLVGTLLFSSTVVAQEPAKSPGLSEDECAVWARELAFADSVKAHDAKVFADFVHAGAAFGANTPAPVRGREAIVADWAGIIHGSAIVLSWYPTAVAIGGEPDIAYSTGPALLESPEGKSPKRVSLATFVSTWHRDSDGTWRVLLDGGTAPRPATDADVAKFRDGRKTCPQG